MKYRAEIDGLRAVAVVPVILFHAGLELFSGGFVGVDVFFVISGYLITTILIDDIENNRFSIVNFYERRARRILPALIFVILCSLPVAWIIMSPFDLKEFSQSLFAVAIFSSNVYFFLKSGYFDTQAELKPFLHTWSLSVEEQYYLLFPIFLVFAWRFGKNKLFWMIVILAVLSLIVCEAGWRYNVSANFYLIPSRAWELLAGSISAFLAKKHGVRSNNTFSMVGLFLILFSIFFFDKDTPFPSVYALVPVFGVVLIILFADNETFAARLLSSKVLVGVGLISYSAYLWHQPLFAFSRLYLLEELDAELNFALILATFFCAYFSWRFVELPFRRRKDSLLPNSKVLGFAIASLFIIGAVGFIGHIERGFPERNKDMMRLAQNGGLSFECSGASLLEQKCKSTLEPKIAIWGDSYAMHFARAFHESFPLEGVHQLTLSSCPPIPGYKHASRKEQVSCYDYNNLVATYLADRDQHNIETVVLAASKPLDTEERKQLLAKNVSALKQLGYSIIIVSPTVKFSESERCITLAMRGQVALDDCSFEFSNATNLEVFSALEKFAKDSEVTLVNLANFMCDSGVCALSKEGLLVVRDEGHLTNEIQSNLSKYFSKVIDLKSI